MADHFVCRCNAYRFPHEIAAGKCTGERWLRNYHGALHEECLHCDLHAPGDKINRDCVCTLAEHFQRPDLTECPAYVAEAKRQGVEP